MSSVGLPCTSRILLQVVANEVDWLLFLPKVRSSAFDRLSRLLSDKKSGHTIPNSKPNPLFFTAGRNIFFGNVMTRKSISIYFWSSSIYPYWMNGALNSVEKEWSAIFILLIPLTMESLLFDGGEGGGKGLLSSMTCGMDEVLFVPLLLQISTVVSSINPLISSSSSSLPLSTSGL